MEQIIFHNSAGYVAENNLFIREFEQIPYYTASYSISYGKSKYKESVKTLNDNYEPISGYYYIKNNKVESISNSVFISREDKMIMSISDYSGNSSGLTTMLSIKSAYPNKEAINKLLALVPSASKKNKKMQKINLLSLANGQFALKEANLGIVAKSPMFHYSEGFSMFHNNILKKLKNKSSGILLLHGEPGTGKTSYIKYLTSLINRKFVIVPNYMVRELSSPSFIPFLLENPNLILVLEDAEDQVVSRDTTRGSGVAEILNLSDGLIGSALNCSIICTFNTKLENIDSALMRKGRLIGEYKFDKLSRQEANKLLVAIGKPAIATTSMSLAEVYNIDEALIKAEKEIRNQIGFVKY